MLIDTIYERHQVETPAGDVIPLRDCISRRKALFSGS
jgi:hypothetical protein